MKRIAVLGSTGSIGTSTLDVIAGDPERLKVFGLAAHSKVGALQEQISRYKPAVAVVFEPSAAAQLQASSGKGTEIWSGVEGLARLASHPDVDIVVVGTAGVDALVPVLRAIEAGKTIALASKELLVMAGELIMSQAREHQARLIPVDSEHAALFQLLDGVPRERVERLVITGSGGSLWSSNGAGLDSISRAQVLNHPKWSMGPKITVDSATLMNKGLEVIEAQWLFGMDLSRIRVLIHPQAVVHAMVELIDGSCLAHMSPCDMRLPIQAALSYPERWPGTLPRLDWTQLSALEFFEPDLVRFPCLRLALDAARAGGTACGVLSAVNEVAVGAFLKDELPFLEIPRVIEDALGRHTAVAHPTLEQILDADRWARRTAATLIASASPIPKSELTIRTS